MTALLAVGLLAAAAFLASGAASLMAAGRATPNPDDGAGTSAISGLVLAALAAVTAMAGAAALSSGEATPSGVGPFVLATLMVGLPIARSAVRHRNARGGA